MSRRLLVAAVLALMTPQLVLARPAVIRVFEAQARAEPRPDAPVVEQLAEGAEVSVSEEAQDGWRRVRLKDGGVGWVEESGLALREAGSSPPPARESVAPSAPPAPGPATPPPDLRPRIYVKDVDHLAELMKEDAVIGAKARSLADRRRAAWIVGGVGVAASVGLFVGGLSQATRSAPGPGNPDGSGSSGTGLMVASAVGLLATGIVTAVVSPRRDELLDVINAWNVTHPGEQFALDQVVRVRATDTVVMQ